MQLTLNINNKPETVDVEPETPLLWVLRDNIGLTGTKYGCGIARCGACTIHVDGQPMKACQLPASAAVGKRITTIEGLEHDGTLHPVQAAFIAHDGFQCGFCTPGQIMSAIGLIREGQAGDDPERVREGMSGNLCRCGAYAGITEAVLDARRRLDAADRKEVA